MLRSSTGCVRFTVMAYFALSIQFIANHAQAADEKGAGPDPKQYQEIVDRGIQFLLNNAQAADGSFSKQAGVGVTALAVEALLRNGRSPDDPAVAKSLKFLEQSVRDDGAVAGARSRIPNYETCLAITALAAAN